MTRIEIVDTGDYSDYENVLSVSPHDINTTNVLVLCEEPKVYTIDDFITEEECNHMINISKDSMKISLVSDGKNGVVSTGRTSKNAWIQHDFDEITKRIGTKIAHQVNMPLVNAEAFQVIYYDVGCEYRNHYDSWDHDDSEKTLRCMKFGGARLKTALVYLNEVEEGGSTKLNRVNVDVSAKKGKLLVFENTYPGTNIKHPLSEHAGMPVIKGEKYAFNLWFKESNSKKLYSEFNPEYYIKKVTDVFNNTVQLELPNNNTVQNINKYKQINQLNYTFIKISNKKNIYACESFISSNDCNKIIKLCDFTKTTGKYTNCWVNKTAVPDLIRKIESHTKIDSRFFENINIFRYTAGQSHGPFVEAYDTSSDSGKKNTEKIGQRIYTMSIPLNNIIDFNFNNINEKYMYHPGTIVIYDNIIYDSLNIRDSDLYHTLTNNNNTDTYVLNIYVRERDLNGKNMAMEVTSITTNNQSISSVDNKSQLSTNSSDVSVSPPENYKETFEQVLTTFENNEIKSNWRGLKSFDYTFKGDFEYFKKCVLKFIDIRKSEKVSSVFEISNETKDTVVDITTNNYTHTNLNTENLNRSYTFDEFNPAIVENVLNNDTLAMLKEYYKTTISQGVFVLGDKQSQRFKAHNEPMSRILHYEILPLIERIVGKALMPTYTYLSAYIKGSDLPAHTDRADCEYTVSFLINKPDDSNWPIYLHKVKQPVKYKGRSDFTPSKDECFEIDCNAGGLMMFSGTDHIHFRENLPDDFYHIVLLHYRSV